MPVIAKKKQAKKEPKATPEVETSPVVQEMQKPHLWTDGGDKVLILRRIDKGGTSSSKRLINGNAVDAEPFVWPEGINVEVSAPDWNPAAICGGGLHGWPWGMGEGEGCDYNLIDDRWLVLAAKPEDVAGELGGGWKCKCRTATKIFDGTRAGAWAMINGGRHRLIEAMSKTPSSGNYSTAASSGDYSTAASSGDYSTAASSGNSSKAASSGENTIAAVAGYCGHAKVGVGGAFALPYKQGDGTPRFLCGKVGEDGIKADVWYEVRDAKLSEVA